ncbi:MAG: hypothetical protein EOM24_33770 [Chloroflexia bacterium]|nr:hypothetical protein [Chloroflexia bacterium]
MAVRQKVVSAAHSLGSDSNWGMLWQQVQRDSLAGGVNRSYADTLNNSLSSNWRRAFNDQSSFMHSLDEIQRTQLQSALGAGGKIIGASLGASGQLTVIGGDGERVSFNVSEDTAKAFARDEARVRSEAVAQTFSDGRGLDYLANVAKSCYCMNAGTAYIQYDSSGEWVSIGKRTHDSSTTRTFLWPLIPRRCDHFHLKFTGSGHVAIYSLDKVLERGGDGVGHV